MTTRGQSFDAATRDALERWTHEAMPNEPNLWPAVARGLAQRSNASMHRPPARNWLGMRRVIAIPIVCVLLALFGVGVAAAASPTVRDALHQLWPLNGGSPSQGYSPRGAPLYMKPVPRFRVFYPAYIPSDLPVRGVGHVLRGGLNNPGQSPFGLTYPCPKGVSPTTCGRATGRLTQMFPPAPYGSPFFPAVVAPLVQKGIETVWFGFHAPLPGARYVSIAEWKSGQSPLNERGKAVTIKGSVGHITYQGGRLTISLRVDGTSLVAQTNTSRPKLVKILESLEFRPLRARHSR